MFAAIRESPEWRLGAAAVTVTIFAGLLASIVLSANSEQSPAVKTDHESKKREENQIVIREEARADINFNKQYVGLPNLGNTCYLNSLLQALSGSTHYLQFTQNIVENQLIKLGNDEEDETCNDILYHFIVLLLQLSYHDQDADPNDLYQLICGDTRLFRIFEQCDAHELNLYIQDKLITHIPLSARRSLQQSEALSFIQAPDSAQGASSLVALSQQDRLKLKLGQNPMLIQTNVALECQNCIQNDCQPAFRNDSQLDINLDLSSGQQN